MDFFKMYFIILERGIKKPGTQSYNVPGLYKQLNHSNSVIYFLPNNASVRCMVK